MDKNKFQKPTSVSIPIQKYNMRRKFGKLIKKDFFGKDLLMELELQHSLDSQKFTVELEYTEEEKMPKVFIETSQFIGDKLEDIPHKYGIKTRRGKKYVEICLYYRHEWNRRMNISDTIVPWAIEWLYFYDMWLITKKWLGVENILAKKISKNMIKD